MASVNKRATIAFIVVGGLLILLGMNPLLELADYATGTETQPVRIVSTYRGADNKINASGRADSESVYFVTLALMDGRQVELQENTRRLFERVVSVPVDATAEITRLGRDVTAVQVGDERFVLISVGFNLFAILLTFGPLLAIIFLARRARQRGAATTRPNWRIVLWGWLVAAALGALWWWL